MKFGFDMHTLGRLPITIAETLSSFGVNSIEIYDFSLCGNLMRQKFAKTSILKYFHIFT